MDLLRCIFHHIFSILQCLLSLISHLFLFIQSLSWWFWVIYPTSGIQSSAVITRSNSSWYDIRHCDNSGRKWVRYSNHNRYPIYRLRGRAMGCVLWAFWRKLPRYNDTALYIQRGLKWFNMFNMTLLATVSSQWLTCSFTDSLNHWLIDLLTHIRVARFHKYRDFSPDL